MTRLLPANDEDTLFSESTLAEKSPTSGPKHLLEMARSFSIEHHSNLVLCTRFLPWMDLAVSAGLEGWRPLASSAHDIEDRFREVMDLVQPTREALNGRSEWCRAVVSFGLVRWWPIEVREKAMMALGPFSLVIHCERAAVPRPPSGVQAT